MKYPGIMQQTSPMTMLTALDVSATMMTNTAIAMKKTLGLIPRRF